MKVPKARKLKSGNWFIQLRLDGESVPVTAPTEKECTRIAALVKAEHIAGKRTPQSYDNITLNEALEEYINSKRKSLSPSTIRGYRTIQRNRLKNISDKRLKDIKNWQDEFDDEAQLCSAKTLKNTLRLVRTALKFCGYELPQISLPQVLPNSRPWLDFEQIVVFLKAIEDKQGELVALLALHSLRRSEILALTYDDIDLKNATIRVSGATVFDEHNKVIDKSTNKNVTSTRIVPIMIPRLKELLLSLEDKSGKLIKSNPNTPAAQINRVCKQAGLPLVGVHGLRHSFASLAYHLKMSEIEVMELGGWSDYQTVHKIYTHLAKQDRLKGINKMTEFYKNANENANNN